MSKVTKLKICHTRHKPITGRFWVSEDGKEFLCDACQKKKRGKGVRG